MLKISNPILKKLKLMYKKTSHNKNSSRDTKYPTKLHFRQSASINGWSNYLQKMSLKEKKVIERTQRLKK